MKNKKSTFIKSLIFITSFVIIIQISNNLFADFSQKAREYRVRGYNALVKNDLRSALVYYQKTIALKPHYAEAHNDLGIIYEKMGWLNRARQAYSTAIRIRPDFMPAYTNLAALYERKGDIESAIFYYKARFALGNPRDPWTQKAWDKLLIHAPDEVKRVIYKTEKIPVHKLLSEVLDEMKIHERKMEEIAERRSQKANELFTAGKLPEAINEIEMARKFAPQDLEINMLERKIKLPVIKEYLAKALDYFQRGWYNQSRKRFDDILTLIPQVMGGEKAENK